MPDGSGPVVPDRQPRPDEVAVLTDELEFVLAQLQPVGRRVLELRLQGEEIAAIASELRINERTVRRWLRRAGEIIAARSDRAGVETANGKPRSRSSSRRLRPQPTKTAPRPENSPPRRGRAGAKSIRASGSPESTLQILLSGE